MNKLKTAEEYIKENHLIVGYGTIDFLKQIQKDTIDYVVKECAEIAKASEYWGNNIVEPELVVNKHEILLVADKLKKEIDES